MAQVDTCRGNEPAQGLDEGVVGEAKKESRGERETWSNKLDFLLALIGFSVGLGNVWRFPYLCFKNGGGAFLIPYLICLVVGGVPLLLLELGLGQFMAQGGIGVWKIAPLFRGIGITSLMLVIMANIYYNVIIAWALYYLVMSFTAVLPWSHCNNPFNTELCQDPTGYGVVGTDLWRCDQIKQNVSNPSGSFPLTNLTQETETQFDCSVLKNVNRTSSAVEFWERKILQIHFSDGLHDLGSFNWQLSLCLILAWVIVYMCVFKGVKSSGKVVYFTATFPYVLITILLVRAVTLENASEGLVYYLKPNMTRLQDGQTWLDAASQIMFSYSLGIGNMAALGSYNTFNHNFFRDGIMFAVVNSGTSLYSGVVIFAVLGFMAGKQSIPVADVVKSGPGLAFVAYPEAVAQMPLSPLWAILFFIMLLLLGIDSQFVGIEGMVTALVDFLPRFRKGNRRSLFVLALCILSCLAGLPMTLSGGMYIFQMFDTYAISWFAVLWVTFFEAVVIGWVYGADRFYQNFEEMLNWRPRPYLKICWKFLTPVFTMGVFIFSLVTYKPLKYNDYEYPVWGQVLGWCLAASSMIQIPIFVVYQMATAKGTLRERWVLLTTPRRAYEEVPTAALTQPMKNFTANPPPYSDDMAKAPDQ
ncbi:sodium- and chloride-dependent GABA transporter 2-like [Asterias amurensis]|uniref:sodium- and chloride-dependent GABA transporter 2-like n=1 Tax=Asterias amurensis TaxID=7602 RepID=UPI003AB84318